MKISELGARFIGEEEGTRLKAYKDTVGVWTIGVGHTGRASPPVVTPKMVITKAQAVEYLKNDLVPTEAAVNSRVKVPLTQSMYDALVSFTFNVGTGAFAKSTLLKKLNARDYDGAADEFLRWVKQPELKGRRNRERAFFLRDGVPHQPATPLPIVTTERPKVVSGGLADKMTKEQIEGIQRQLDKLGYHEVGKVDGLWGPRTRGALSSFQLDQTPKLVNVDGSLDQDTVNALFVIAKPRLVDTARANATEKTVLENAPGVVRSSIRTRAEAVVGVVASVAAAGVGYVGQAYGYVRELELNGVWIAVGIAVICAYFGYRATRQVDGSVKSFQAGKVM